jgi:hypothetical protein
MKRMTVRIKPGIGEGKREARTMWVENGKKKNN